MPNGTPTHIHREEHGHGVLTFLTLAAVLALSISALVVALSSSREATDARESAAAMESMMAVEEAEMDSSLRALQELGATVDLIQERLAQTVTASEAATTQAALREALASLEASIATTQADLTLLKGEVNGLRGSLATAQRDITLDQVKIAALERSLTTLRNAFDSTAMQVAGNQDSIADLEDALKQTIRKTSNRLAYATVGNVFLIWWNHGLVGKEVVTQQVDLAVAATGDAELQAAWETVRTAQTRFSETRTGVAFQVLIDETDPFLDLLAMKLADVGAS